MGNPGGRLKGAGRQILSCGMFGACADSVLSPPPANGELLANANAEARRTEPTGIDTATQWRLPINRSPALQRPSAAEAERQRRDVTVRFSFGESVDAALLHFQSLEILHDAVSRGELSLPALRSIGNLAQECARNRELLCRAGVANGLVSVSILLARSAERAELCGEALNVLLTLAQSQALLRAFVDGQKILDLAELYLNSGPAGARFKALSLLEKSLAGEGDSRLCASVGLLEGLLRFVREEENSAGLKSATKALLALCLEEENRARAVEAGAVDALLSVLPNLKDVSAERALATLDLLGTVWEGRCALRDHALAIPLLVDMILKVSDRGTEYAASILCAICAHEGASDAREAAVEGGALTQLLLLVQSDCTCRAKRKALHLLKLLHKISGEGSADADRIEDELRRRGN